MAPCNVELKSGWGCIVREGGGVSDHLTNNTCRDIVTRSGHISPLAPVIGVLLPVCPVSCDNSSSGEHQWTHAPVSVVSIFVYIPAQNDSSNLVKFLSDIICE